MMIKNGKNNNKFNFILLITLVVFGLFFTGCNQDNQIELKNGKTKIIENYVGSEYNENYIWGGAMNLAWSELNENILKEKLKLKTQNEKIIEIINAFNNPVFSKNDLDKESYYVKSGFGQETVNLINTESKKKFPEKSFKDLDLELKDLDIISYAYFFKEIEYEVEFDKKEVLFENNKVKGFYAKNSNQKENVQIINYSNKDNFIISLKLKDENDEIYLAKGFEKEDLKNVLKIINSNTKKENLQDQDSFEIPEIHLKYHKEYNELINLFLENIGFEKYIIGQMFENINFDMDNVGVRVENEAVIVLERIGFNPENKPKSLILNKPFWIVMKRYNSKNPYFLLYVKNTEFMNLIEKTKD
jgi:hypothetical protein